MGTLPRVDRHAAEVRPEQLGLHLEHLRHRLRQTLVPEARERHDRQGAGRDRPVGGDPWSDFPIMARPKETPPVPDSLDWDLWLGPAKYRPYHPIYHPLTWRGFWDFGTGALGDMACHTVNMPFMGLDLANPTAVEAQSSGTRD